MIGRLLGISGPRTTTTVNQGTDVITDVEVGVGVEVNPVVNNVVDMLAVERGAEKLGGALERAAEAQAGAIRDAVKSVVEAQADAAEDTRGALADLAQIGGFLITATLFFWLVTGNPRGKGALA